MMRRVPEVGTLSKGMRHKGRLPYECLFLDNEHRA